MKEFTFKGYEVQITGEINIFNFMVVLTRETMTLLVPISHVLTRLEYFLWGYVKCRVYKTNPLLTNELKAKIVSIIGDRRLWYSLHTRLTGFNCLSLLAWFNFWATVIIKYHLFSNIWDFIFYKFQGFWKRKLLIVTVRVFVFIKQFDFRNKY